MSAMVAGTSSSCSATFTTRSNHSIKNSHLTPSKTLTLPCQVLFFSLHGYLIMTLVIQSSTRYK
jgi:hypothetical protein